MSKLSAFAGQASSAFRMPKFPNLQQHIQQHGLIKGAAKFDEALNQAVNQVERILREQFEQINSKLPPSNTG